MSCIIEKEGDNVFFFLIFFLSICLFILFIIFFSPQVDLVLFDSNYPYSIKFSTLSGYFPSPLPPSSSLLSYLFPSPLKFSEMDEFINEEYKNNTQKERAEVKEVMATIYFLLHLFKFFFFYFFFMLRISPLCTLIFFFFLLILT